MTDRALLQALGRISVRDNLRCLGCGYEHNCGLHGCAIIRQAVERLKQLAPPANDPLTLEELRKMDGEPVWLQSGELKRYDVFERFSTFGVAQFYKAALPSEKYGKTWTVYRRKPEEG